VEKHTGDVAAWPRETSSHTTGDRVSFQVECDNRNGAGGQMSCVQYHGTIHYEHIHVFRYDFRYQRRDLSWVAFRCSGHNLDLRGSSVARNSQATQDSLYAKSCRPFGARIDKTDSWDFRRLLRARRERPRRRAAEQRYELTPFQLTELHALPLNQGVPLAAYRIGKDHVSASLRCGIVTMPM